MGRGEAIEWAKSRPINAWMSYGVLFNGVDYVVVGPEWIKKFGINNLCFLVKGQAFPNKPINLVLDIEP